VTSGIDNLWTSDSNISCLTFFKYAWHLFKHSLNQLFKSQTH
jgi:hypothetical protein